MENDDPRYDRPDPALSLVRRSWLPFAMALFGALVVVLIVGGVAQQLSSERNAILEEARKHTSNLARAFEEHIRRTLKEVDQALLVLKRGYESDPANFRLWDWPGKDLLLQDLSVQIAMADKNGTIVGTIDGPAPVVASVRNEDYFLYQVNHDDNALFIGKPVSGRRCRALDDPAVAPPQFTGWQLRRGADRFARSLLPGALLRDRRPRPGRYRNAGRPRRHCACPRLIHPRPRATSLTPKLTIGENVMLHLDADADQHALTSKVASTMSPRRQLQRVARLSADRRGRAGRQRPVRRYEASRWRLISAARGAASSSLLSPRSSPVRCCAASVRSGARDARRELRASASVYRTLSSLRISNDRFRAIIETARDAILTANSDGVIEIVNPAAARIFGYSARRLRGRNVADLAAEDPPGFASISAMAARLSRRPHRALRASSSAAGPTARCSTWKSRSPISSTPACARSRSSFATSANGNRLNARWSRH